MVLLVRRAILVRLVLRVQRVIPELLVLPVRLGPLVPLVLRDRQVLLD